MHLSTADQLEFIICDILDVLYLDCYAGLDGKPTHVCVVWLLPGGDLLQRATYLVHSRKSCDPGRKPGADFVNTWSRMLELFFFPYQEATSSHLEHL